MFAKSLRKIDFENDFKHIIESHKYADTRQLLSSSMFLLAARIKRTMLKIAVIEN